MLGLQGVLAAGGRACPPVAVRHPTENRGVRRFDSGPRHLPGAAHRLAASSVAHLLKQAALPASLPGGRLARELARTSPSPSLARRTGSHASPAGLGSG